MILGVILGVILKVIFEVAEVSPPLKSQKQRSVHIKFNDLPYCNKHINYSLTPKMIPKMTPKIIPKMTQLVSPVSQKRTNQLLAKL